MRLFVGMNLGHGIADWPALVIVRIIFLSKILIRKNDVKIGEIVFQNGFPVKREINEYMRHFGGGEYELEAPNGRTWRVVKKDLLSYLGMADSN